MRNTILLLLILLSTNLYGNINYIHTDSIPNSDVYTDQIDYIKTYVQYFDHWSQDWDYPIEKSTLIEELQNSYNIFSRLDSQNVEVNYLLGDISHYLYNLEDSKGFENAVKHYEKGITLAPTDFRGYWFLANHYALSNMAEKSIHNFKKALKYLPTAVPADFWTDYATAASIANMPTNCLFAMEQAKLILGEPSYFEKQLGQTVRDRIKAVKSDSTYKKEDLWQVIQKEPLPFISRQLGIKVLIDSSWYIDVMDYKNNAAAFIITPPAIKNKNGIEITYTIALIFRVAKKGDDFDAWIKSMFTKDCKVDIYPEFSKYKDMISMELKDSKLYPEYGGGHLHLLGIERQKPFYSGLLIEEPMKFPEEQEEGKTVFYQPVPSYDRFEGTILYAIMLDTCEDIYPEAFAVFKDFFERRLVIE
jgi:tetratricopeptide (TPR) repeat protein